MAQVTLRDLASNEDIVVPQEGYIFGRAGGDADIQIEDPSISRRQARVAFKNGRWVLETLAVPQGSRAPRPLALAEGTTFTIGESEFEVVALDEEEGEVDPQARTFAPTKSKPAPSGKVEKTATAAPPPRRAPTAQVTKGDEEPPPVSVAAMFVAVPRGIAYYLVNVPKLLVNPFGTVRTTIETLPNEPMGRIELIGYALPALLATALLGSISGGIATLIRGGGFDFLAFVPIVPAIIAVVSAVITGFVFHPVFEWIITKLKGTSDARSRTNYFLQTMTLSVLLAVPSALGTLLSALPVPFINLLGPLLGVAASLVSLYVTFQWLVFFDLVKWARLAVLVGGGVLVLLGVFGFVKGVIDTVSGGGGTTVATSPTDLPEGVEVPAVDPSDPEAVAAALQAKAEQAAKAPTKGDAPTKPVAKADEPKDKGEAPEKPTPPPEKVEKPVAKVEPPPEKKPEPPVEVAAVTPPPKDDPPPPPPVKDTASAGTGYAAFARKRDAIEKLFEADPTVLAKSRDLQGLYADYLEAAFELDKKYGKDNAKRPERRKLNAHLRDAELFGKTSKTVDQLAGKLGIR